MDEGKATLPVRYHIDDWPYTPRYLQATLDPALIARHGQAMLRRTLNNGRVVAFVSSGVSMSYGRLGWGRLVKSLVEERTSPGASSPIVAAMAQVLRDLNLDGRVDAGDLQSGRYPAAFQFLEQIERAGGLSSGTALAGHDARESALRQTVRALLFDDWGHVHTLAQDLIGDRAQLTRHQPPLALDAAWEQLAELSPTLMAPYCLRSNAAEPVSGRRLPLAQGGARRAGDATGNFAADEGWRGLFDVAWNFTHAANLAAPAGQGACSHIGAIEARLLADIDAALGLPQAEQPPAGAPANAGAGQPDDPGKPLLPLLRFVLPALLRLSRGPSPGQVAPGTPAARPRLRSEILPASRDPLLILSRDLGIRRFITTNYDLDIERLMRDRGFMVADHRAGLGDLGPGGSVTRSSTALGAQARDYSFDPQRAVDLVHFALQHQEHEVEVLHLHGRATLGTRMVVTESDYQGLYLRRGPTTEVVNDSISLMFGSNPMLFVGCGMNEDDVLRPLRQFVAERKSTADRSAVVMLPAEGTRARQIEEVVALYSRYGVYTLHFGLGSDVQDVTEPAQEIRWLAEMVDVTRRLDKLLEACVLPKEGAKAEPAALGAAILANVRLGGASASKAKGGTTPLGCAAQVKAGANWELRLPKFIAGVCKADLLEPDQAKPAEIELLNASVRAVDQLIGGILGRDGMVNAWLGAPAPQDVAEASPGEPARPVNLDDLAQSQPLVLCLRALLKGLPDALRGLALCLELSAMREGWRHWKWRRDSLPLARPVGAQRTHPQREASAETAAGKDGAAPAGGTGLLVMMRDTIALLPLDRMVATAPVLDQHDPAVPVTDRFCLDAPSKTFQDFLKALQEGGKGESGTAPARLLASPGRRVFLLVARRGLGKGHFFEMLWNYQRVQAFIHDSWPSRPAPPDYAAAMYVNLGLSLEVFSAIDRLIVVLVDRARKIFRPPRGPDERNVPWLVWQAWHKLHASRIGCLQAVLRLYAKHAGQASQRLLITLSSFDMLFDRQGHPKNAMLYRVIDLLLGEATAQVPIDVLLLCSDASLPRMFLRQPVVPNQPDPPHQRSVLKCSALDGWNPRPPQGLAHLLTPDSSERVSRRVEESVKRLALNVGQGSAPPKVLLHVLRGARAIATVSKYFPEVALAIALMPGKLVPAGSSQLVVRPADTEAPPPKVDPISLRKLQGALVKWMRKFETGENDKSPPAPVPAPAPAPDLPVLLAKLAARIASQGKIDVDTSEEGLRQLCQDPAPAKLLSDADQIDSDFRQLYQTTQRSRYLLTIVCAAAAECGWTLPNPSAWVYSAPKVIDWLKALRTDLAPHLSMDRSDMIIARVLELFQSRHERRCPLPGFFGPQPQSSRAALLACQLLAVQRVTLVASGAAPMAVEQLEQRVAHEFCGPLGWRLQQRLLWHVAVMGLSVQADVLAMAPLVEADCRQFAAHVLGLQDVAALSIENLRQGVAAALVNLAIDVLVHRALLFRLKPVSLGPVEVRSLTPQGGEASNSLSLASFDAACAVWDAAEGKSQNPESMPDSGWRFAIHRFLQRSILEHLRAPFVEYAQVDSFGLSLWASQPDELPRPNQAAAHDIAGLVAAWTGFPESIERILSVSAFHWARDQAEQAALKIKQQLEATAAPAAPAAPADAADAAAAALLANWRCVTLPSRMLRAALAIVRTVYAVGVVSRFDDFGDVHDLQVPEEGYFEQHHLQVRWLLEQAIALQRSGPLCDLLREVTPKPGSNANLDPALWGLSMEALAPFYIDEMAWLYNECGLFCLVEGRLDVAAAMFGNALNTARQVEGEDERGALWCRIHLNLAIVDIERGRIREAAGYLRAIMEVDDENPILRILARGFLALVDHCSGNLELAERAYLETIEDLNHLGHLRSVAIFSRHLAELYRIWGPNVADKAVRAIDQAIAAATKGGHEDIRQLANLSRVRLAIAGVLPADALAKERPLIQQNLDAVERYGHRMGMPRLLADTAFARSLFLLDLGETRHAASLAHACLEVSNTHNLRLRQMTALALLGRIYERRGLRDLSEPLLARAFSVAFNCNYSNMRESVSPQGDLPFPGAYR